MQTKAGFMLHSSVPLNACILAFWFLFMYFFTCCILNFSNTSWYLRHQTSGCHSGCFPKNRIRMLYQHVTFSTGDHVHMFLFLTCMNRCCFLWACDHHSLFLTLTEYSKSSFSYDHDLSLPLDMWVLNPNHDLSQTVTQYFWSLNLTRSLPERWLPYESLLWTSYGNEKWWVVGQWKAF